MIQIEVVKAAVKKLVSMLNPAGAVIQAIIAIYNTVTFFIEKAKQIGAVVASFIDSIAAIAAGQVDGAAKRVEQTMANTLIVVIAFLAKFAGLGGIPDKLVGIVKKIRAADRQGPRQDRRLAGQDAPEARSAPPRRVPRSCSSGGARRSPITGGDEPHTLTFQGERKSAKLVVRSDAGTAVGVPHPRASSGKKQEPKTLTTPLNEHQGVRDGDLRPPDRSWPRSTTTNAWPHPAPSARRRMRTSGKLNTALTTLSGIIGKALASWGADGDMPDEVVIERAGGFTVAHKANIAARHLAQKVFAARSQRQAGPRQGLARSA